MLPVTLYASTQARPAVLHFVLDLQQAHCQVRLRSLSQLPPPSAGRVASLRLELAGLLQDERTIRWTLSQYAQGLRLPDAYRQECLRADLDVTLWGIAGVTAKLGRAEGRAHD